LGSGSGLGETRSVGIADTSRRWRMKGREALQRAKEIAGRLEFARDDSGQSQFLENLILIGVVIVIAGGVVAIVDAVADRMSDVAKEIRGLDY